jgi:TRAP-type C4-dicarboxylate transport system permease small subunit
MRRFLDGLYHGSGVAAASCLLMIFTLVAIQVAARLVDTLMRAAGMTPFGFIVPSIAEICGFLLAAASFLALAHTLVSGGHIRVGMLVERLAPGIRRYVEALVGTAAAAISLYATVALGRLTLKSLTFNDVSYGFVAVPLALPQGLMTLGLAILTVSIIDVTIRAFARGSVLPGGREA